MSRLTSDDEIKRYYSGTKKKQPTNWLRILIQILVLAGIGFAIYWFLTNNTNLGSLSGKNGAYIEVTTDVLYKELKENESEAKKKYENQYVELSGRYMKKHGQDAFVLGGLSGTIKNNGVICKVVADMEKSHMQDLLVGAKVTVKGQITEIGARKPTPLGVG
jgi:hypothetical protein